MIPSIRRFLLFNLLLSITVTSSITAVGNYLLDNADIQQHLDTHLQQTTWFLNDILTEDHNSPWKLKRLQNIINKRKQIKTQKIKQKKQKELPPDIVNDKFQFQIWNNQGKLVLHSENTSKKKLATKNGFGDLTTGEENWRVYSIYNKKLKLHVSVAELYNFRQELERRITWDNLLIILWTYPLLGLLIWLTVGHGLKSLDVLARRLAKRTETDFGRLELENVPIEIHTLIESLNRLFLRLQQAFERNKRFASDAAHELRTPLAALKTQTQLALLASTKKERNVVLKNLSLSIDRATHVVQQLLTLSRLSDQETLKEAKTLDLTKVTTEVLAQLVPTALEKDIDIELLEPNTHALMRGNETALSILIRNLVDNAIRYTPENGKITVRVNKTQKQVVLYVIDNGPGISPELRARVFERFYRVLGTKAQGSGLGLAIVQQIAELHRAKIKLGTPESGKGLQVEVIFPT